MTIKKFQGKSREEAIEKAKEDLGDDVVVMNVKEIRPRGLFSSFKKSTFEVTAAIEEKASSIDSGTALRNVQRMHESIKIGRAHV